jgi:hypothetical protein
MNLFFELKFSEKKFNIKDQRNFCPLFFFFNPLIANPLTAMAIKKVR